MNSQTVSKHITMNKKILLFFFLISGFAFAQTTVTLEDQCNCEVLSGTAVTAPGVTLPPGADTGDVYVNTNTGTIYFWDGNSWELTSSDNQQLQDFTFDSGTNILSLDIESGNTVTVDLSGLNNLGTDSQDLQFSSNEISLTGDPDNTTIDLSPYVNNDTNEIQDLELTGDNLTLTNDPTAKPIDLSDYTETVVGTGDISVTDDGSGNYTVNYVDGDSDDANEIQDLNYDASTQTLNITNNGSATNIDLSGLNNAGTDNQDIESLAVDAISNVLTVGIEDGTSQTVDLSHLDNAGTDNQDLEDFEVNGANLDITIQNGNTVSVPLADIAAVVDTDDQTLATTGAAGQISITGGNAITLNVNDADSNIGNEHNTAFAIVNNGTEDVLRISDTGNDLDVPLSSFGDHDWYEVGGTSAPDAITDNIFTQGNVSIGTITSLHTLDVNQDTRTATHPTDSRPLYVTGAIGAASKGIEFRHSNGSQGIGFGYNTVYAAGSNVDQGLNIMPKGTGEIGVGTTGPTAFLDINGDVRVRTIPVAADTDQLVTADTNGNLRKVNSLKASKVFYPPSIEINASVTGTFTIDLYAQYIAQFGSPVVSSGGTIPTYLVSELDYHVTFADPNVFGNGTTVQNMSVNASGVLSYEVFNAPADYNSLINVVFVVK